MWHEKILDKSAIKCCVCFKKIIVGRNLNTTDKNLIECDDLCMNIQDDGGLI